MGGKGSSCLLNDLTRKEWTLPRRAVSLDQEHRWVSCRERETGHVVGGQERGSA